MAEAAAVLSEVDVELTLLGSFFMAPDTFALMAEEVSPHWFSDAFTRYVFEAVLRLHSQGARLSPQAVVAVLPEDCGGIPRKKFYASCCAACVTASAIPGLILTLKDRWARRMIADTAALMQQSAQRLNVDPMDIAGDAILSLDNINASRSERRLRPIDKANEDTIKAIREPDKLRGVTTGLAALDNKLNGYKAGQLYVVAGRPGMGKSAFMVSSLRRTAEYGHGVAIFSLEMTDQEISARMFADMADNVRGPGFGSIVKGLLSAPDEENLQIIADSVAGAPLYIDDSPRLTFSEIAARSRQLKATLEERGQKLAVVCIDHMGLVTPSDRYAGNKVAEAGEVSGQARALAKELNCCVLLLCQLSREVEKRDDKRPIMSDLRWSGEIEQDAHVIGFLYREAYYLEQDAEADPVLVAEARNRLDFLIRKNRNGETGDVRLWCSIAHSMIRDIA